MSLYHPGGLEGVIREEVLHVQNEQESVGTLSISSIQQGTLCCLTILLGTDISLLC